MGEGGLLERARHDAGMSQTELARRAGTSRPTLSAYEHGRKSPTVDTAARVLAVAGFELEAVPVVRFVEQQVLPRGRSVWVPDRLPRLGVAAAVASVRLPLHLSWSAPDRTYRLVDRRERARLYEVVLREGGPDDIRAYVDGVLLVDLWDELVLPAGVRAAWQPVVAAALAGAS